VLTEFNSPFGPVVKVRPSAYSLASIASLPGVQQVERSQTRVSANDLSRVSLQIAPDSVATNNYLDLTGTNVLVMVNDTGVDPTNPDLVGRVSGDGNPQFPGALMDVAGHGTHVAGIIAGDGKQSLTVSNASGSVIPAVDRQFRGKAPGAKVFATATVTSGQPEPSDAYLQELAARPTYSFRTTVGPTVRTRTTWRRPATMRRCGMRYRRRPAPSRCCLCFRRVTRGI
jgi:subtilisin family serine protease